MTCLIQLYGCSIAVVKCLQDTDKHTQIDIVLMSPPLWPFFPLFFSQNAGGISCRKTVTNLDSISLVAAPPPSATICHAGGVWVANMGKNNTYIYTFGVRAFDFVLTEKKKYEVFFFCLHNYRCVNLKYNYYQYLREKHVDGKRVWENDGGRWVGENGKWKVHSLKRHKEGEKESGIYFHLSTALKAINTYKASASGHWDNIGHAVCLCVWWMILHVYVVCHQGVDHVRTWSESNPPWEIMNAWLTVHWLSLFTLVQR